MFQKVIDFLFIAGLNGIVAIFIAAACYFVLALALLLGSIPVAVVAGSDYAVWLRSLVFVAPVFTICYVVVFFRLMGEDYQFIRPSNYFGRRGV